MEGKRLAISDWQATYWQLVAEQADALCQSTTLVGPFNASDVLGFSSCTRFAAAKAGECKLRYGTAEALP